MALYEDFDLDITTGMTVDDANGARTARTPFGTCVECHTDFDTCKDDCSITCGGVRTMPCDR